MTSAIGRFAAAVRSSALLRLAERFYVFCLATLWRVNFNGLFDRRYYLSENADVLGSGMDPLFHFLRFGASEGRKPHPLFEPAYYLDRYPDVMGAKRNPLIHFLRFGGLEGRSPHPHFDSSFYLANRPDVLAEGANPLVHFLEHGASEGQLPHPKFDPTFYLTAYPDVAAAGMSAVEHFARYGAAEGRLTYISDVASPPESYLPSSMPPLRPLIARQVDVIVPVFKGMSETRAALESVLSSRCATPFRVIAVNDCSPEPCLTEYLRELAKAQKIWLIEHERNLGFVQSVNAGMKASIGDVILLNSDTLVFDDWLDRLVACAYSDERTGTVTPFSNNATICSYPAFGVDNPTAPLGELAALDSVFEWVNRGRSVEIPTAVGFCMLIRRVCLQDTGEFDAKTFGLGYGEENDFCMRAAAKGWKHRLACDVFVFHAGRVSFGEASARRQAAMQALLKKHPGYSVAIERHAQKDPAHAYRIAVTAQRIRSSGKRVFLCVLHAEGGGVVQHVRELAKATDDQVIWLTLKPSPTHWVTLECLREGYQFCLSLRSQADHEQLAAILRACGVERIHIHHLMGQSVDLLRLAEDLSAPVDFTVHDYYTICPQVTLSDERGRYCGEPDSQGCDRCLAERPPGGGLVDIASWRAKYAWVLTKADRVIAPSMDAATRVQRYCPEARVLAAAHQFSGAAPDVVPKRPTAEEPLRIAVLGTMAIHKGFQLLQECTQRARSSRLPLEFTLVGRTERGLKGEIPGFQQTGAYSGDASEQLDRVEPHLVWFPARCPETFSYTLSIALMRGLPVAAHDVGAFAERLGGRAWTWVVPRTWSAAQWTDFFLRIREDHFLRGNAPECPPVVPCARYAFYPDAYLEWPKKDSGRAPVMRRSDSDPIRVAAAISTHNTGQIQACGYVRVIQTLTHPAIADTVRLTVTTPRHLALCEADAILVQRVAVQDMATAERIIEAAHRRRARLIFEIDDDLFGIPVEHPEHKFYADATQAAKWLASQADAVVAATEVLGRRMLTYNRNTVVLPNYLDDRIWPGPSKIGQPLSQQVRIVYIGTNSHQDGLELLGRAVRKLSSRDRERIHIEVVGVSDTGADWFEAISIPRNVAMSYPRFAKWLQGRNDWHWGVAPLLDTLFNRAKSPLKFLEYAALGLPSLCSEGEVYGKVVRPTGAGLLTANSPEAWCEVLERMLSDARLWQRLYSNCVHVACENTISVRAEEVRSVWKMLAGMEPLRVLTEKRSAQTI
jgi:GT2 family glycosyltransferase/glycosyltransferase involved in cell wall biosynthesis